MTTAILYYGVFCDDNLDCVLYSAEAAKKHSREMSKDGYVMKTIVLDGVNAEDAFEYISREVFGMMKTLSPKVKAHIVATFGVKFVK